MSKGLISDIVTIILTNQRHKRYEKNLAITLDKNSMLGSRGRSKNV